MSVPDDLEPLERFLRDRIRVAADDPALDADARIVEDLVNAPEAREAIAAAVRRAFLLGS